MSGPDSDSDSHANTTADAYTYTDTDAYRDAVADSVAAAERITRADSDAGADRYRCG